MNKFRDLEAELARIKEDDPKSLHILQLCMLHLRKMSEEDKLKIISLLNDILGIKDLTPESPVV